MMSNAHDAFVGPPVTYSEWLEHHPAIDKLVAAALPPLSELEQLTFDAILARHAATIAQATTALGITLTDAEVEHLLERLAGVKEMPPFRREHYDVLC